MTASDRADDEARGAAALGAGSLDAAWRRQMHDAQQRAVPNGRVLLSCPAPLNAGGLGRHMGELLDALERAGQATTFLSTSSPELPAADLPQRLRVAAASPLARVSRAWRMWSWNQGFDARVAGEMPRADHLIAFNGTATAQFAVARREGWESLSLVSANSHFQQVIRQHELAHSQYPVERPWATHLRRRNLREYELADRILVSCDYIRDSFLERGFDQERLAWFPLTPHPRYEPRGEPVDTDTFDIVYVGSLTVHKGVPLLLDALRRIEHPDVRLVLVGGWGTRGMRRHLERARTQDARVSVAPGDPLPHLLRARLCVHPAYEDGFGYAPAEALACGVPVIASADTGMKSLIEEGRTGQVVPTGDREALTEAIEAAVAGRLLRV